MFTKFTPVDRCVSPWDRAQVGCHSRGDQEEDRHTAHAVQAGAGAETHKWVCGSVWYMRRLGGEAWSFVESFCRTILRYLQSNHSLYIDIQMARSSKALLFQASPKVHQITYGYGQKHKAWITHPNPHTIHTSIHGVWIKRWVCDPSPWITQPPPPLLQPPLLPQLLLLLPLHLPATALLLLPLLLTTITSITIATDLAEAARLNFKLTSHSSQKLITGSL